MYHSVLRINASIFLIILSAFIYSKYFPISHYEPIFIIDIFFEALGFVIGLYLFRKTKKRQFLLFTIVYFCMLMGDLSFIFLNYDFLKEFHLVTNVKIPTLFYKIANVFSVIIYIKAICEGNRISYFAIILSLLVTLPILYKIIQFIPNDERYVIELVGLLGSFANFIFASITFQSVNSAFLKAFSSGQIIYLVTGWAIKLNRFLTKKIDFIFYEYAWAVGIMLFVFALIFYKDKVSKDFSISTPLRISFYFILFFNFYLLNLDVFNDVTFLQIMSIVITLGVCIVNSIDSWILEQFKRMAGTVYDSATSFTPIEVKNILNLYEQNITDKNNLNRELIISNENSKVSKQLAHDIRSPLAALDVSIKSLSTIELGQKALIRSAINRIHDIANNLVGKNEIINSESNLEPSLIFSVVSSIVSEKRIEYRGMNNITIDFNFSSGEYGLFSEFKSDQLQRILSNLINNSIESIDKEYGLVEIELNSTKSVNQIIVKDNGRGISEDNINRVFDDGFTHGKEDGTGIGLYHAVKTVARWGGSITCSSELGISSEFVINLPVSLVPSTYVKSIMVEKWQTIVVVDDDISIHQIWKGRIQSLGLDTDRLLTFSSPEVFLKWIQENSYRSHIFFFDYEFLGSPITGMDLIKRTSTKLKYLVTSRFEENYIKAFCEKANVKIIDKGMIGFIPLSMRDSKHIRTILIDDDELIHMSWKMEAEKAGVKLDCFFTVAEFLAVADNYDKDIVVYVDSSLADGIKGEVESEKIFNAGFENIYLATGYSPSDFDKPNWIKEIVGKRAKFS